MRRFSHRRKEISMGKEKRYWWLKLPEDFFRSKEILYLKRKQNGYRLVYIYLSMMLTSLKSGGAISFDGMGETPEEEIAIILDEDVSLVTIVVDFLKKHGLLIERTQTEYYLPFVEDHTGTEGASAQRMRDMRSKQQVKNAENVTPSASQCDATNVTSLRRVREEKEKKREEKNRAQKPTAAHEPSYGSHEQYETDDQPWMHDKTVLGNL